ncbi:MAG: hypothetical protein ABSC23_21390 [Bryobacteraceae bacterium]
MNLNLETLKREILAYLDASEFAVFHGISGGLEGQPVSPWDAESYPDYRAFLDVARKAGVKLVVFAAAEFEKADLDELEEQIEEAELSREDQREYRARLHDLRPRAGQTCSIELGFDYNSRRYVYAMRPDWYDDFLNLEDEIMAQVADDDADDDSLGGYYSKN